MSWLVVSKLADAANGWCLVMVDGDRNDGQPSTESIVVMVDRRWLMSWCAEYKLDSG